MSKKAAQGNAEPPLYTLSQREKRDSTIWTIVQGVLAPTQFLVFIISMSLIVRYFMTGEGYLIATYSVILKTLVLLLIMITGAIWEKVVFGQYLLAPAFFWEDIVSFFVILGHLAYVVVLIGDLLSDDGKILVALFAYGLYLINAIQFLLKFRAARANATLIDELESEAIA